MKVSVNAVWDETLAFIRAERALIVPLALGTIYLASVILIATAVFLPPAVRSLMLVIAGSWSIAGQLALIDLTRGSGRSVREALGVAMQRLPWAVLVYFVVGLLFTLLAAPIFYALMRAGYSLEQLSVLMADQSKMEVLSAALPGWAGLYMTVLVVGCLFLFVRLLLWKAALVELGRPVLAFKASWATTHGKFWALFGLLILALIVIQLVDWALGTGLGTIFLLLGQSMGSAVVAQLVPALLVALVSTALQTVVTLFLALFYRRAA
ncbi:MAG TPA: hypothetical protein VL405_00495 [Sphingomonas sp.]|jgi:hypothetical protein|nr:hypothetical protein [Sphingomonas sp.]